MVFLIIAFVLVILVTVLGSINDGDVGLYFVLTYSILVLSAVGVVLESIPTSNEKGYIVFPVYEVSGNDTISTTYYVREKE